MRYTAERCNERLREDTWTSRRTGGGPVRGTMRAATGSLRCIPTGRDTARSACTCVTPRSGVTRVYLIHGAERLHMRDTAERCHERIYRFPLRWRMHTRYTAPRCHETEAMAA